MENNKYLFKSERLGFRNWTENDFKVLSEINSDPEVMEYFPSTLSEKETKNLLNYYQLVAGSSLIIFV